jgi:hypothetical protein
LPAAHDLGQQFPGSSPLSRDNNLTVPLEAMQEVYNTIFILEKVLKSGGHFKVDSKFEKIADIYSFHVSFNYTYRYIDDILSINNHNVHSYCPINICRWTQN